MTAQFFALTDAQAGLIRAHLAELIERGNLNGPNMARAKAALNTLSGPGVPNADLVESAARGVYDTLTNGGVWEGSPIPEVERKRNRRRRDARAYARAALHGASEYADAESEPCGYICKRCGGASPVGVGYTDHTPGALAQSQARTACDCGYSQLA